MDYIDEMIIGSKPVTKALSEPLQRVPYMKLKAKKALKSTTEMFHDTYDYSKSKFASLTAKAISLILLEILIVVLLHFFAIPQMPIWILILPLLSLDYLMIIVTVSFLYNANLLITSSNSLDFSVIQIQNWNYFILIFRFSTCVTRQRSDDKRFTEKSFFQVLLYHESENQMSQIMFRRRKISKRK